VVWDTPVPQLYLAIEGKVDFVKKTNPFGSSDDENESGSKNSKSKEKPATDKNIIDAFQQFKQADKEAQQQTGQAHTVERQ